MNSLLAILLFGVILVLTSFILLVTPQLQSEILVPKVANFLILVMTLFQLMVLVFRIVVFYMLMIQVEKIILILILPLSILQMETIDYQTILLPSVLVTVMTHLQRILMASLVQVPAEVVQIWVPMRIPEAHL